MKKEMLPAAVTDTQNATEQDRGLLGVAAGFADFDIRTLGLQSDSCHVLAGHTGVEKSTLFYSMAQNTVLDEGRGTASFSLDLLRQLKIDLERAIAAEARVDIRRILLVN